ncbi:MAG TPA: trypsin-like peptidase domain-containing protein [Rhodoblastus sp.]|nr:trypsin-like peptidase domain-containing protein [Rhodoblastus sp.]
MKSAAIAYLASILFLSATTVQAEPRFKNEADLVHSVMPGFVNIYNRGVKESGSGPAQIKDEVGSGFIIDPNGLIVTNSHVVNGAYALFATLSDGTHVPAKLVGKLLIFDLALIKVDVGHPLTPARLGDSDKLRLGERVVAIGNALGFSSSVSSGVISAFHRQVGLSNYDDLIQTDATINQGNSGGPLFNMDGEVIGVNQAIYTRNGGGSIGIGFSIPINAAKAALAAIRRDGRPRVGWLGVSGQTFSSEMADVSRIAVRQGVIVSDIAKNGAAAEAGIEVGDIILKVGSQNIDRMATLNRIVAMSLNKTVPFDILRKGKPLTLSVSIKELPQDVWTPTMPSAPKIKSLADLGITFAASPGPDGAVVEKVAESSIAWSEGVRPGDVVRKVGDRDIRSAEELETLMLGLKAKGDDGALVLLGGPNGARWIAFAIKE